MHLKRYEDAVLLVRGRLAASPADITLLSLLGTIYYRSGREAEALEAWDRAIAAYPSSAAAYRAIASTMIESRLLDRAAAVYRRGREACHDPALFVMELAQLSVVMMDYRTATEEYVRWLLENPSQIAYVQGRMAAYTGKEDGRSAALRGSPPLERTTDTPEAAGTAGVAVHGGPALRGGFRRGQEA